MNRSNIGVGKESFFLSFSFVGRGEEDGRSCKKLVMSYRV